MWFRNGVCNVISNRPGIKLLKGRRAQFEPLEIRALLSVSPACGMGDPLPDPSIAVLAACAESSQTVLYTGTLTAEQVQVQEDLHRLLSRGGTIAELTDFQPVLMPEAFLDELYDTYGVDAVWDSLGRGTMAALFGSVLDTRRDTRVFPSDPQTGSDTRWVESLDSGQAQVREELRALLSRGGTIAELEGFQPVLMPEAFLDEVYDTYGVDAVWDSLGRGTMAALFGSVLDTRRDTRVFPSEPQIGSDTSWVESLDPGQTQVREELHAILSHGGKVDRLEDLESTKMPADFLDELYNDYGVNQTWDSVGRYTMAALFGDFLDTRRDTRVFPFLAQSCDLIGCPEFGTDYPLVSQGSGYAIVVLDTGFDLDHPSLGTDSNSDGIADRIVYQYDFGDNDANATYYSTSLPDFDHGTHVAAIAAGNVGVATQADLILLKVADVGGVMSWGYVEDALSWVCDNVSNYNIVSVNMSFGSSTRYTTRQTNQVLSDELAALNRQGVTIVSAAGNDYEPEPYSALGVSYPAADLHSIAVGAVYDASIGAQSYPHSGAAAASTGADRIAPFSQRSVVLDLMAPGAAITAAVPGGTTGVKHGTSMAAPHVAGAVALAQKLSMQELGRRLSPSELLDLLQDTGVSVVDGDDENDNVYNTGATYKRLNVSALGDAIAAISPTVYNAGARANNGIADTFTLSRSGSNLVLARAENDVIWSTVNIPIAGLSELQLVGSDDGDSFIVNNLGNFTGVINIQGVETASVTDQVQIYDTPGDDVWDARDGYGLFSMENAYRVSAANVYAMHGYANSGGSDQAYLSGNAGDNKLKTYDDDSNIARIYLNGVYSRAKFFDSVTIFGNGGNDEAILYDTASNDVFTATKDQGLYQSPTGGGFTYAYRSFETVTAYGGSGFDAAYFSDSPFRDEVRARPLKVEAQLAGSGTPYLTARNFDYFYAEALTSDGMADIMKMHDDDTLATIDLLVAEMDHDRVRAKFYYSPADCSNPAPSDLIYESLGFEITKGYSAYGPDKKDTDGVDPGSLAWEGVWQEI